MTLSSDSSDINTSTEQTSPSANAALPPHPRLQTSYPPSAHSVSSPSAFQHRPLLLAVLLRLLPPPPLTLSGFSNGMLKVFEPEALNYFTFFRPILSTLSVSRNPILTHLPHSGFSALCSDRTHSRFSILSLDATHASGGVIIFVRKGLSFSELFTSSLSSLDPYSDYVGVNIFLISSSSLSFLNVYAPLFDLLRRMAEPTPFLSPFLLPPEISSFRGTSIANPPLDSRGTSDPCGEEVFDWVISFDLLPLNDPDIPTLLHRSSGSRSSPDISFAAFSLALYCSWEVLQDLSSNHLPILLSIPLSPSEEVG